MWSALTAAVFATMQDAPAEALLTRPLWHVRDGVVAGRDNHSLGVIHPGCSRRNPFAGGRPDAAHRLSEARHELEILRVPLKVRDHLLA
jgi:hypothetical protein